MCGGGGAGGIRHNSYGGAGATAIVRSPYVVTPGEVGDVHVGGHGSADYYCSPRCATGEVAKFDNLVAPGATSASRVNRSYIFTVPVSPPNFAVESNLLVKGALGGGNGELDGKGVNGTPGGKGGCFQKLVAAMMMRILLVEALLYLVRAVMRNWVRTSIRSDVLLADMKRILFWRRCR